MKIGKAILTTDDDFAKLIASITEETAEYNNEETAVVFMGHGTHHEQNAVYSTLQQKFIFGDTESQRQDAGLCFVQIHESSQQHGTHFLDGGTHWVTLFTIYIVESYWTTFEL